MSNSTNKILTALAAGIAIGGVLGILFAPDKGENTRKKIADNGKKLSDSLMDTVKEGKNKLTGFKNNLRERADALVESAEEYSS